MSISVACYPIRPWEASLALPFSCTALQWIHQKILLVLYSLQKYIQNCNFSHLLMSISQYHLSPEFWSSLLTDLPTPSLIWGLSIAGSGLILVTMRLDRALYKVPWWLLLFYLIRVTADFLAMAYGALVWDLHPSPYLPCSAFIPCPPHTGLLATPQPFQGCSSPSICSLRSLLMHMPSFKWGLPGPAFINCSSIGLNIF